MATDWVTISSLGTAGGTLALAAATFASIKSANRSARVAERALLAGQRPLLVTSRDEDPLERVRFGDGVILNVSGHGAGVRLVNGNIYMAIALRNGGAGLAVIHGWQVQIAEGATAGQRPDIDGFRRQLRDLYIPSGATGFWQGAIRDSQDPMHESLHAAAEAWSRSDSVPDIGGRLLVDLLYGDQEGGQRTITRFGISPWPDVDGERAEVLRYWNLDREDPR